MAIQTMSCAICHLNHFAPTYGPTIALPAVPPAGVPLSAARFQGHRGGTGTLPLAGVKA
jgi:hypothetical protein